MKKENDEYFLEIFGCWGEKDREKKKQNFLKRELFIIMPLKKKCHINLNIHAYYKNNEFQKHELSRQTGVQTGGVWAG